jgi:hypothetical protein
MLARPAVAVADARLTLARWRVVARPRAKCRIRRRVCCVSLTFFEDFALLLFSA